MKKFQRFLAAACAFIMIASLNGCAGSSIIPPQDVVQERPNYGHCGHIGLVAARFQPQVNVYVLTNGKGAGTAKGAGQGALNMLGACGGGSCSGSLCGVASLICAAVAIPFGATVGAILGTSREPYSWKTADAEAVMKIQLDYLRMQGIVVDKVAEYAREVELPGFSILRDQGPEDLNVLPVYRTTIGERLDTVMELSVVSVEAQVTGVEGDPIFVKMKFRVRLVNASDGKILDSFTHQFSDYMSSEEWLKDNGRMYWYREFAEIVVDELLLNYRPVANIDGKTEQIEVKETDSDSQQQPVILADYVLQPLYPEVLWVSEVDSQEPTFRWEALPRLRELREASAGSKITDVKYDLRIFGQGNIYENNYQVTGLTEPKFKPSGFFKPCHKYVWTVRARFLLDGKRQATEWSGTYYNRSAAPGWWRRDSYPPTAIQVPNISYYLPFRIPAASPQKKCP